MPKLDRSRQTRFWVCDVAFMSSATRWSLSNGGGGAGGGGGEGGEGGGGDGEGGGGGEFTHAAASYKTPRTHDHPRS